MSLGLAAALEAAAPRGCNQANLIIFRAAQRPDFV